MLCFICHAQAERKIFVVDSISRKPIEYACVVFANTDGGTYSNTQGFFYVPDNIWQINLSIIGYYSKTTVLDKNIDTIFLSPQVYMLGEAKILPTKKKRKPVELGYAKNHSINNFIYKTGDEVAVYIAIDNEKNVYRRIKSIIIKTRTNDMASYKGLLNTDEINDYPSVFKITFYQATENKEIGLPLHSEDIVFTSDVLKRTTNLNVETYNVYAPTNGVFVAIEFVGKLHSITKELIINFKEHVLPTLKTSWGIRNSIVYEKRKFFTTNNAWQRVDKDYEFVKQLKTIDKSIKESYTPLISIVLE